jgi:hypothetical protein
MTIFTKRAPIILPPPCNPYSVLKQNLIPKRDGRVFSPPLIRMQSAWSKIIVMEWKDGRWSIAKAALTWVMFLMTGPPQPIKDIA